ncbi:TolB family protein [Micromonospora sp. CA-240977]|uniref:TolB family protein n=1 Tax=Micromonospora sp. CA-240977 TaxID=3239957 RepID=UPI003D936979
MNDQRLRLDLADLAEEVTVVDLRDRTLRTSRRLGIQRTVATSAAALVLIAAAAGTAFAIRPDQSPAPLPADSPSVTATPTAPPSPTSSPSTPSSPPSGGSSANTPTVTIGRLFYGPAEVTGATSANLRSWHPGDNPVRLLALPALALKGNVSVSSDGHRVAWVDSGDTGNNLFVANVDGSDRRQVRSGVDPYCVTPVWSPDGRQLLFRETTSNASGEPGRYGMLEVRSTGSTVRWWKSAPEACHALWSADGQTIAMNTNAGVTLYGTDGTTKRVVPGFSLDGWRSNDITSLSPDGSRIALLRTKPTEDAGDVARDLWVNVVLDTRTGKEIRLPLGGRELRQVYFPTDGSMVVRVRDGSGHAVLLVSADGRKISETAEPASLADMQILAVAG